MRGRGFTLIEIMIVVAIIAIVAAVAVPSILAARRSALETTAVGSMRVYAYAQQMFHRNEFHGDLEPANVFRARLIFLRLLGVFYFPRLLHVVDRNAAKQSALDMLFLDLGGGEHPAELGSPVGLYHAVVSGLQFFDRAVEV